MTRRRKGHQVSQSYAVESLIQNWQERYRDLLDVNLATTLANEHAKQYVALFDQVRTNLDIFKQHRDWTQISSNIAHTYQMVANRDIRLAIEAIQPSFVSTILASQHAILPSKETINSLMFDIAPEIKTLVSRVREFEHWQSSLTERISTLITPWAFEDHLQDSVIGFSRIARLHDISSSSTPFASRSSTVFEEELGTPNTFYEDDDTDQREDKAIDSGMNPELIEFPSEAYPEVLIAAGFDFKVSQTLLVYSTGGNSHEELDPQYSSLFKLVEVRLRDFIASKLSRLSGEQWPERRIARQTFNKWNERKQKDHFRRGDSHPLICYADFMDLAEIISQKDNWEATFSQQFVTKGDFLVSMHRLNPIRNALAHSRSLVRSDQITLFSEAYRILSTLNVLK